MYSSQHPLPISMYLLILSPTFPMYIFPTLCTQSSYPLPYLQVLILSPNFPMYLFPILCTLSSYRLPYQPCLPVPCISGSTRWHLGVASGRVEVARGTGLQGQCDHVHEGRKPSLCDVLCSIRKEHHGRIQRRGNV